MKRAKNLFEKLVSDDNLLLAIDEVNRTHHWRTHHRPNSCTAWVEETKEERVKELRQIIIDGFEQKKPHVSQRWDASARKWRTVSEPAQWPDQYVHHALIQVLHQCSCAAWITTAAGASATVVRITPGKPSRSGWTKTLAGRSMSSAETSGISTTACSRRS